MSRIFISYRRADSAGYAGRLYEHLSRCLEPTALFMDIDDIPPGADFVQVIEQTLAQVDTVLVMIGPQWLEMADNQGRRLDNPYDFVRLEIQTALDRPHIRVIPVLVNGAHMPGVADLPMSLQPLARRNAIELSNERFAYDVDRLVSVLTGQPVRRSAPPALQRTQRPNPFADRAISRRHRCAWTVVTMVLAAWIMIVLGLTATGGDQDPAYWASILTGLGVIPLVMLGAAIIWPLRPIEAGLRAFGIEFVFGVLDSVAWYVNSADNIDIPSVIVVHSVLSTALAAIIAGLMSFSRRRYESRGRT